MRPSIRIDNSTETAVRELFRSKAESRIYLFLLRTNGAKTENIIKGTKLHPSTVRELLSKMHHQRFIIREKQKNDSIGKNPYLYKAISPLNLLKRRAKELETRLNKLANLSSLSHENNHIVTIHIVEETLRSHDK